MDKVKYLPIMLFVFFLSSCTKMNFEKNTGKIFGTTYHFTYQTNGDNLEKELLNELEKFSHSLNNYDTLSIISRINKNSPDVVIDYYFETCFQKAQKISKITDGAFDITIAPIVNAWGFGFKNASKINKELIDSLMQFVGYQNVQIHEKKIIKKYPQTMLDVSAIAKGYAVDVVANYLEKKMIANYMVEIGGELRVKGQNPKKQDWKIGIDKPIEDPTAEHRQLQTIVRLKDKSLATSGNYRQFYQKNGVKYAHTINPKTGFPELNDLLSVTVLAKDCMTADAFATAFMVMGAEKTKKIAKQTSGLEVYLIYKDSTTQIKTYSSEGFEKLLEQ